MRWFALRVKSRHEKAVACNLQGLEFASFTPLYTATHQWADRQKTLQLPLFPGYVFCQFSPGNRFSIMRTPGVIDIVKFGDSLAPVDDSEIHAIQKLMDSGCKAEPVPYLASGQPCSIASGPLTGLSGTVVEHKSGLRLVLSVALLRRSVLVEIDRGCLMACQDQGLERKGVAMAFALGSSSEAKARAGSCTL
jgi:transcription antitermination factor NusG